jgi:uncharacterized protein YbjT (DUF2867 family)
MILVTGARGNVGAELLQLLAADQQPARAAVRSGSLDLPGIETIHFDFADPATFAPALHGVDRVFLMRPPALADTRRYFAPFVNAMQQAGIKQVVLLSLLGAERNPVVPHRRIEQLLEASSLNWTFLRPSFFMQNLSGTHRDDIREFGEILVPAGNGATSFIDVRDIAAVAQHTLTEPGHDRQAYPLTGNEALTYAQAAEIFSAELGRPIVYRRPSILRFVRHMRRRGMDWSFILVMIGIYTTARLGLAAGVTADTERLMGRPPITLAQFVADYRACWQ